MVCGQWSVVSGLWSVVSRQWSVVSGQSSVVGGQWNSFRTKNQKPKTKSQKPKTRNPKPKTKLPLSNPVNLSFIIRNMTYEYLIKRLLPFSMGFLAAVFVTSLFQAFGSLGQTANVPEVVGASYGSAYTCKNKLRGYGRGIGTGTSSADDTSLKVLHKPRPAYTDEARSNGTEGTVQLRVTFVASGRIGSVEPLSDLGDGLTEQAIAAARELQFEPAKRGGTPVSVTKTVEYTFSIY